MEKFTKGDWIAFYPHEVLSEGLMSIESDVGKLICKAEVYKSNISEATANAHLIAAAPEMYAELLADVARITKILETFTGLKNEPLNNELSRKIKLLAKARGE